MEVNNIQRIQLLINRGRHDEALALIADGLGNFPDNHNLYQLKAEILIDRNKLDEALEAINTSIGLAPWDDHGFYRKSDIYLQQSKYKLAHEAIDVALELVPNQAHYYGLKATIFLSEEKRKEAISTAREGLRLDPENTLSANVLSLALGSTGETHEAETILEGQLENDPENAFTQATTGYNYLRKNNIPKAKEHFQAALMINPNLDFAKSGMLEAIKGSNFLYRGILRYAHWMEQKSESGRWAFIIGLVVVVKVLPFLAPFYLIFVFGIWFVPPMADMIVYFDKHGRYLMNNEERLVTMANISLFFLAVAMGGLAFAFGWSFLTMAVAAFFAILPVYGFGSREKPLNRAIMVLFALVMLGSGIAAIILEMSGQSQAAGMVVLFVTGIAFTWLSNVFDD